MLTEFFAKVEDLGFKTNIQESGNISIFLECCPSWRISLCLMNDGTYFPLIYFRQVRIEEVTDLNDIIPAVFAGIVKSKGHCSFRFLGEHNEFSGIEDELYGMYIFPAQPFSERIRPKYKQDLEGFFRILDLLFVYHLFQGDVLGYVESEEEDFYFESLELNEWIDKITSVFGNETSYVANVRKNPDWFYFRSFSEGLSVCKSPHIAKLLKQLYSDNENDIKCLQGVRARVELFRNLSNAISYQHEDLAHRIFVSLNDATETIVISQENQLLFVSDLHLILKHANSGFLGITDEKELIWKRQQQEIELLFGDRKIEWKIKTREDSAVFEDLVLELLNREPYIFSAKKVAPTNQSDNGRDLICEYNMRYDERQVEKDESSIQVGKMIVQCKTNLNSSKRSSIGKSDVDIANTIFDYRPDGYMLVVNTQITRDLTEMLERQKDREEQNKILWWNSFDLEERLRKNPDILIRYKNIVGYA
jgi:hypothetical protein